MFLRSSTAMRCVGIGVFAACALMLAGARPALAAPARQPLTITASDFLANPSQILQQYPNGGPELIRAIRDLALADESTLSPILGLLANANAQQKAAIGAALAQAARIVVRTKPAYAARIQEAVANTKDQVVVLAYTAAAGDRPTAAVGGGGGGAGVSGGAIGGQTSSLPGGPSSTGAPQPIGGPGTPTPLFSVSSGVSGSGSTSSTTTTILNQSISQ